MEAKLKLNDYLANAPNNYHCVGDYTDKSGKTRMVDAVVKAHTADLAIQRFKHYFTTFRDCNRPLMHIKKITYTMSGAVRVVKSIFFK